MLHLYGTNFLLLLLMHVCTLLLSLGLKNLVMISDHYVSLYLGLAIVVLFSTSTSTYSSIFSTC